MELDYCVKVWMTSSRQICEQCYYDTNSNEDVCGQRYDDVDHGDVVSCWQSERPTPPSRADDSECSESEYQDGSHGDRHAK